MFARAQLAIVNARAWARLNARPESTRRARRHAAPASERLALSDEVRGPATDPAAPDRARARVRVLASDSLSERAGTLADEPALGEPALRSCAEAATDPAVCVCVFVCVCVCIT
jgi:hypothetical protein